MLWDASYDENNIINGQHYSALMKAFMKTDDSKNNEHRRFEIVFCYGSSGKITISTWQILSILGIVVALTMMLILTVSVAKSRRADSKDVVKTEKKKKYFLFV